MTLRCSTCGAQIGEGEGHYSTPSGLFCLQCGVSLPIPSGARVTITVTDPERFEKNSRRHS